MRTPSTRPSMAVLVLLALLAGLLPVSAAAGSTGVTWSSTTTWSWVTHAMTATAGPDQRATAVLDGASTPRRNGAVVLRDGGPGDRVVVSVSGSRYQVRSYAGGRETLLVDTHFRHAAVGTLEVELRGATLTSRWEGEVLSTLTHDALARQKGLGTGLAVWQDRPSAVVLRQAVTGPLAPLTPEAPAPVEPAPSTPTVSGTWLSGASGAGVPTGTFADWRGRPVDVVGTWNDNYESHPYQWSLRPGFEYGSWQGDVDVAVGGIYKDRGETWAAAADGAYDARWRLALDNLRTAWGERPGTVYVRFAHEFNGDWYPWSVTGTETASFVQAWKRFRAIQQEVAPRTRLVFCPNAETSSANALDWRAAFPGAAYVDVVSVDHYNQYPFVQTAEEFTTTSLRLDGRGAPLGLEQHRRFAASVGRPFAISEWSSNADLGDSPVFVQQLHAWLRTHGGTGPGEVLYEVQFNVAEYGSGQFQLYPTSRQPMAAEEYARLW